MSANKKEEHLKRLIKSGVSKAEANRVVHGWTEPDMKTVWDDIWKDRPDLSPPISQRDAFEIILKTAFGADWTDRRRLSLPDTVFKEVVHVLVTGIDSGHVESKIFKKGATREQLSHNARSELQRLLREDEELSRRYLRE